MSDIQFPRRGKWWIAFRDARNFRDSLQVQIRLPAKIRKYDTDKHKSLFGIAQLVRTRKVESTSHFYEALRIVYVRHIILVRNF